MRPGVIRAPFSAAVGGSGGKTAEAGVGLVQEEMDKAVSELQGVPFLKGVEVTVTFTAGANVIAHKLGRQPRGWFPLDLVGDDLTFVPPHRRSWDAKFITLYVQSAGTGKIWVY